MAKACFGCKVETEKYHTVQVYAGEPVITEVDIVLCDKKCYPELKEYLKKKTE